DVEKKAEKVGITLPYSLDDSPFYQMLTVHVAPEGTTYLEAISNPLYPWYEVNYGIEDVVREDISDETGTGYSEYSVVYDKYQILFGSTENELYKYVFHLDENDTYILDNDPLNQYLTEMYRDINLQITTEVFYDFENNNEIVSYSHEIFWVDDANKAVILIRKPVDVSVTDDIEFPTEMIEFAKEIIDLNIK
ncbi:MAG: hypothetical protein IKM20_06780, partial [Erysipelotrichales bacterium]|nr:hypothetical protein [Erysipelotrichales bacterium]